MSKKIGGVVALAGLCALSFLLLSCGTTSSRPSGVLYVLTQGSNGLGNNVSTFSIDLNSGALSLVNSNANTCPTPPTQNDPSPCGAPVNIVLDPTGSTAYVLNQGISSAAVAPTIYSFPVNSDGSLGGGTLVATLVSGDFPANMIRDAAGQYLFVITQGFFPARTDCPASGSSNSTYAGCPSVAVFTMSSGALTLASGSPFYLSKVPTALSAITFTPPGSSAEELLFVTNNQDICTSQCVPPSPHNDNTVSVYTVGSSGVLTETVPFSPYAIAAINPVSVIAVNTIQPGQSTGGIFVYVGNNGATGDLNPFYVCTVQTSVCTPQDVQNNLMSPLVQVCPQPPCPNVPPTAAGQNPVAQVVDPTNNFLYSLSNGSNQVFGFKINTTTGTLAALSPNPDLPTGSQPVALALHPQVNNTGQFLFVSNSNSDNVTSVNLNTTSGAMTSPSTTVTPATPSGLTAR